MLLARAADCGPPGCDDSPAATDLQLWLFLGLGAVAVFVVIAGIGALLRQRRAPDEGP